MALRGNGPARKGQKAACASSLVIVSKNFWRKQYQPPKGIMHHVIA
ncbi:hypothetical protein CIT292_06294 [Citrobacter youngae ATCC 29220]|uniref:Uncharacterized protein n=1 Tax=Citrobacter youngae ATCC 29220 TaxID=500640 RepID=D4B7J7_9ENTR|nr:hypothetical protein CIT292_06294 [Citrobacter youngae ATCC 29220]